MAKNSIEIKLTSDSKRQPTVIKRDAHGRRVHESKGQPSTEAQEPVRAVTPSAPVQSVATTAERERKEQAASVLTRKVASQAIHGDAPRGASQEHGPGQKKEDKIVPPPLEKKKPRSLIKEEKQVEQEEDDQSPEAPATTVQEDVGKKVRERFKKKVEKSPLGKAGRKIKSFLPEKLDEDVTGEMARKDTGETVKHPRKTEIPSGPEGQKWRMGRDPATGQFTERVYFPTQTKPVGSRTQTKPVGSRTKGKGVVNAAGKAGTEVGRGAGRALSAVGKGRGSTGPHAIKTSAGRGSGGGTPKALAGGGAQIPQKAGQISQGAQAVRSASRSIGKVGVVMSALSIAVEKAVKAFVKLDSFLVKASDDIQAFSPEIIGEKVERSVMLLEKKIERAGAVGTDMAKYEAARTKVIESLETMKTALIKFLLPYMIKIMEWVAKIAEFLANIKTNLKIMLLVVELRLTELVDFFIGWFVNLGPTIAQLEADLKKIRQNTTTKMKAVDWDHMDRVLSLLTGAAGAIPGQTPAGPGLGTPPQTIASGLP